MNWPTLRWLPRLALPGLVLALLAAGCGARHAPEESVENPYARQAQALTQAGIAAMQRERWDYAANVFARALKAAQLTADVRLAAHEWYNLGTAHAAMGKNDEAAADFRRAEELAREAGDAAHVMRARLARALLPGGDDAWRPGALPANFPADVHLAAGRLAERRGDAKAAAEEYGRALKRADKSRIGLLYQGEARLGLARLARAAGDAGQAARHAEAAITLFRQVGAPRLIAHALLLDARVTVDPARARHQARQAWLIYQALEDGRGQRDALQLLATRAAQAGDEASAARWRARLEKLGREARESAGKEPAHAAGAPDGAEEANPMREAPGHEESPGEEPEGAEP